MRITTQNLGKKYGDKQAVSDLNISIEPGKILGLLGPNGAGKSTTIKMLTGQTYPTSGKIIVDDVEYEHIPHSVRDQIGVMPQEVIIWEDLNILENLQFAATLQGMSGDHLQQRIDYIMDGLNLGKEAKTLARNLSGGYKRRVNLAISIIHDPKVVFLDEPTPGVDPQTRRFLWEFIRELRTAERAVVLTDHYLEEAEKLADYVVIVDEGKVVAEGTVDQLKKKYGDGSTVEVKFDLDSSPAQLAKMKKGLKSLAEKLNQQENIFTLFGKDGVKIVREVSNFLEKSGTDADSISLREPSLEDVFLVITGKSIRE